MRLARAVPFALLLLACFTSPSRAFDYSRHRALTHQVLGRMGVTGNALKFIEQGVVFPDINQCKHGCYCPWYLQIFCSNPDSATVIQFSQYHFDNNELQAGMDHVNRMMASASYGIANNDGQWYSVGVALMDLGIALHAVQDFYAHSTMLELNVDLVRISGHIGDLPIWNGEQYGGAVTVGGVSVDGVQTGYVDLTPPAGSVTHDQLNKDNPGKTEGKIRIRKLFPAVDVTSYYGAVSGDVQGNGTYGDDGLAPRHTIKAIDVLRTGGAVYDNNPAPALAAMPAGVRGPRFASFDALVAWANADSMMTVMGTRIDSILAHASEDSLDSFPFDQVDANGMPLPAAAAVGPAHLVAAHVLENGRPNPFRDETALRFLARAGGRARLEAFDPAGRRVALLFDRDVTPGWKEVRWSGRGDDGVRLASGVYLVRLTLGPDSESVRVALTH